jgi:hypothetical protein
LMHLSLIGALVCDAMILMFTAVGIAFSVRK